MRAGETIATLVIIIGTVVAMRRRGEGWGRTVIAGAIAWLASALIIGAWELLFSLLAGGRAGAATVIVSVLVVGLAAVVTWAGVRYLTSKRE